MTIDIDESRLDEPGLGEDERSFMLRTTASAGPQVREAAALVAEAGLASFAEEGPPRALVVAGVGPAARAGDVLAAVAGSRCRVPVLAHRSAGVPSWVGAADVVIAVSASGKGPEALAAAEAAAARGARLVAIGAPDSMLQSYAERARAPFVPVPRRGPARASVWALTVPVLLAARALNLIQLTPADLAETAARLDAEAERCRPSADAFVNPAKSLAIELAGSIPVIWGTSPLATVAASRFADQLAANSRYPAVPDALVEAGRGRVGLLDGVFGGLAGGDPDFFADRTDEVAPGTRLRLVLLRDDLRGDEDQRASDDPFLTAGRDPGGQGLSSPTETFDTDPEHSAWPAVEARRAEAVAELAADRGIGVSTVWAQGESALERFASLVAVPDFASVYLALLHGIDPVAVPAVTELKERVTP
jgi:hypothetical protein